MKRVLGIDFGHARIGVAASDELQMLAFPVETIANKNTGAAVQRIAQIAKEKNAETIVVGIPKHMNGELGESAAAALELVEKLKTATTCTLLTWDERLTTVAATRALRESGVSARNSRGVVDQVAAQVILQGYLDRMAAASPGTSLE